VSFRTAILTISDRGFRGERQDLSGPALRQRLEREEKFLVAREEIVGDELEVISERLKHWADNGDYSLILTTGGTGFSPRDITPEATQAIIERLAPGFSEAMRSASLIITPHAMISRAVAGIRGHTLVVNLPGSPKAAQECLEVILPALPHALEKLAGDPADCAS